MCQTCSKLTSFNFGDFTHCSDVSVVDFEQVNTGWVAESFYVYLIFHHYFLSRLS